MGLPLWKSTQEREMGDCSQNYPGTLLVTLGVLIHIRFLHLVISKYSMYCWLVWTKKATSCLVEIGCMLFCLVLIMIPLCHWCLLNYVTPCLNLINTLFMFKSFSLLSPCPAHGLTWEMVLSSLNLFLPIQTVENVTSKHAPTSL